MTSNVGADILARLRPGEPSEAARPAMMERIRATFAPEFLNRLDDIILFNRLTPAAMEPILDLELRGVDAMLRDRKVTLELTARARSWLLEHGYDETYGARPMKRLVQTAVLTPLASFLIATPELPPNSVILCDVQGDELAVRQKLA